MKDYLIINDVRCFLDENLTIDKANALCESSECIAEYVSKRFPNFDHVDFCDVHAGGIQIRGFHKQISGFTFGGQPTIKYDFSNLYDAVSDFIRGWEHDDTPENIAYYKKFLTNIAEYGCD